MAEFLIFLPAESGPDTAAGARLAHAIEELVNGRFAGHAMSIVPSPNPEMEFAVIPLGGTAGSGDEPGEMIPLPSADLLAEVREAVLELKATESGRKLS